MRRYGLLLIPLAAPFAACDSVCEGEECAWRDDAAPVAQALPDAIRISDPGLHPEGVEYDAARGRFLVSSVTRGTVTAVADDGSHSVFIEDPDINASIGIHIDEAGDRLLVANADRAAFSGQPGHAMLGAYDLETGERLFMTDLGATVDPGLPHFANDIAVGPDGTAYVTDSMTPVVYAVDVDGTPRVLTMGGPLAEGGFLNGIEYHPDGFLIVGVGGARGLVKVTLADEPVVTPIAARELFGIDGLLLLDDGTLVVVAPGDGQGPTEILHLRSTDDWATVEVVSRVGAAESATTAAARGDAIYAVDARFPDMGAPEPAPHFDITRVVFP